MDSCWVYVFGLVFPHTPWPFHWPPELTFLEQPPNMQIDLHHSHFGSNHRCIHHHLDHWCWVHNIPVNQKEAQSLPGLSESRYVLLISQHVLLQKLQANIIIITLSLPEETIMKEANVLYQHEREGWRAQEPNLCKLIRAITNYLSHLASVVERNKKSNKIFVVLSGSELVIKNEPNVLNQHQRKLWRANMCKLIISAY